jgi:hypothetical protein
MQKSDIVDIFKLHKINELKMVESKGKVHLVIDKQLNRRIVQMDGNVTTSVELTILSHKRSLALP